MNVDRCVCFNVSFARLQKFAAANSADTTVSLEQLQTAFGCGRGCGLCIPYIRKMLRTGQTTFPVGSTTTDQSMP